MCRSARPRWQRSASTEEAERPAGAGNSGKRTVRSPRSNAHISEISEVAGSRPERSEDAFARVAAERILDERDLAAASLASVGVRVESAPARSLVAAVVNRYLAVKRRGEL